MTVSSKVGMSGSAGSRVLVSTASGRIFPALSSGNPVEKSGTPIWTWPAIRSVTAAGLLR